MFFSKLKCLPLRNGDFLLDFVQTKTNKMISSFLKDSGFIVRTDTRVSLLGG